MNISEALRGRATDHGPAGEETAGATSQNTAETTAETNIPNLSAHPDDEEVLDEYLVGHLAGFFRGQRE